jgi:hypothetical protein
MSSERARLLALAVLTVAVAGSGIVALGAVCDFDPACGEQVDRSYQLSDRGGDEVLSYELVLEAGAPAAESVNWTTTPPTPTGGENGTRDVFLLTVLKNDVPLDPAIRHVLPGGNGTIAWNSGVAGTATDPGDEFRFTLFSVAGTEEVAIHRTRVTITR